MYLEFLKAYRVWLDAGAPLDLFFTRYTGLCFNLKRYVQIHTSDGSFDWEPVYELRKRLVCVFGDADHPFNEGSALAYDTEANRIECHLNPKRNAFVDAEIQRLEKQ